MLEAYPFIVWPIVAVLWAAVMAAAVLLGAGMLWETWYTIRHGNAGHPWAWLNRKTRR